MSKHEDRPLMIATVRKTWWDCRQMDLFSYLDNKLHPSSNDRAC